MAAKITVFTTNRCPSCQTLKKWLDGQNIDYQVVNLEEEPDRQDEVLQKSGSLTVPVTSIVDSEGNEQVIVGPNYDQIKSIINNL